MKKNKTLQALFVTLSIFITFFILFIGILYLRRGDTSLNSSTEAYQPTGTLAPKPTLPLSDIPEATISSNAEITVGSSNYPDSFLIEDFPVIFQNPELPTGCEVTSLAMVLNYLGFDIDKLTLADSYLPKSEDKTKSMYSAFIGNPKSTSGYGCYSPAIVKCAASYLKEQDTFLKIYDYTNSKFETLYEQISKEHPCIIWGTIANLEPYATDTWIANGEMCQWFAQEHCMVLIGYDLKKNQVTVADPIYGIQDYDLELFKTRYDQMFRQAIFIY